MQDVLLIVTDKRQMVEVHAALTIAENEKLQWAMQSPDCQVEEIFVDNLRVIISTGSGGVVVLKGQQ